MPWRLQNQPSPLERVISGVCYLTGGIAGILYIILARPHQTPFFRYHFLMSIILTIIYFLLSWSQNILVMIVAGIVQASTSGNPAAGEQIIGGILQGLQIFFLALYLVPLYGMVGAFLGKKTPVPLISKVVEAQM